MTVLRSIVVGVALVSGACGFNAAGPDGGDDGDPLTVGFRDSTSLEDESSGSITIDVELSRAASGPVTVGYVTGTGSAIRDVDFTSGDGSVLFPANETTASIPITIIADGVAEGDETIVIELRTPSQGAIGVGTHTLTISANVLPRLSLTSAMSNADENGSTTFEVQLTDVNGVATTSPVDVSFDYAITGTATLGADYNLTDGSVTIPAGMMSASLTLGEIDDPLDEDPESAIITISNSTAAVIVTTANQHTHTIDDNDDPPDIGFSLAANSQSEAATTGTATVALSMQSGRQVQVSYALTSGGTAASPEDITVAAGTLTFAPGQTSRDVPFTLVNDSLDEDPETAAIALSGEVNANLTSALHTLTINDDDPTPSVQFTTTSSTVTENPMGVTLTVQLSAVSGRDVTVGFGENAGMSSPYMNVGADYTFSPGSPLSIPAGMQTVTFTINVAEDTLDEIDETLVVDLIGPTNAILGAAFRYSLLINDDGDPAPVVQFDPAETDQTVNEQDSGNPQFTYRIVLSTASGQDVTADVMFGGDADSGDFTVVSGDPVSFPAGSVAQDLRIGIITDSIAEPGNEDTIIMTLVNAVNATIGAENPRRHIINDDD